MFSFFKRKPSLREENELLKSKNDHLVATMEQAIEHIRELDMQINAKDAQIAELDKQIERLNEQLDECVSNTEARLLYRINELGEMSLEGLRTQPCKFDVYSGYDSDDSEFTFDDEPDEAEGPAVNTEPVKWAVVTSRCRYGGCDLPTWFDDERSARIYAILRTECGFSEGSGICNSCSQDYMSSCV